ncbi:MAG: type II secretion system protein M [Phycisphaerales bacterium]|nr:MAG: type II secretion system protein M [Phycisphaerales bacterium]
MRLTQREKLLAVASTSVVVAWALYALAIKPTAARVETLRRILPEKQLELEQLRAKSTEYTQLSSSLANLHSKIASQDPAFELLPFLESLIDQHKIAQNVVYMKPHTLQPEGDYSETIVEIRLENVQLSQLVDFLSKVESSDILATTKTLHIQRHVTDDGLLDSTVEIHNARLIQTHMARN